jgi:alpha-D-ribose 1-methylphosphonate 5-triphosphate synthase subunit PhnL
VALTGVSGAGKSTLMRMIWGNYRADAARSLWAGSNWPGPNPRVILDMRRRTLGHVSQFLRVIPRVPTLEMVAEPFWRWAPTRPRPRTRAPCWPA